MCISKGLAADMEMSDLSEFAGPKITVNCVCGLTFPLGFEVKSYIKIKILHKTYINELTL